MLRVLHREHRLQGRDRDGELVAVGLTRREILQLQAGLHDRPHPALAAVAARPLDDLEEIPAIRGTPRIREASSQYQAGRPSGAKTKIATIMTTSRKLVPQRG